jgi:hypothetical protein
MGDGAARRELDQSRLEPPARSLMILADRGANDVVADVATTERDAVATAPGSEKCSSKRCHRRPSSS